MKNESHHLIKYPGRKSWYFRYAIPTDVRHAFLNPDTKKPLREILQSTKEVDLDNAKLKRDIYLSKMVLEIKAIRTGEVDLIEPLAIDFQRKITAFKEGGQQAEALLDAEREKYVDKAKVLFPVEGDTNKISQEHNDSTGAVALEELDKTGNVKKYFDLIEGKRFDAYIEQFNEVRKRKGIGQRNIDNGKSQIKKFTKHQGTIEGTTWKRVKEFTNKLLAKGLTSKTVQGYLDTLSAYWKYLRRELEHPDAQEINPFQEPDLPPTPVARRVAWESEDIRRLLQTPTIHSKNNPQLLDTIMIGMFTGCRIEEICQLKVKNIEIKDNARCIFIEKSKTDKYHRFGKRHVPIHSKLEPVIDRLVEENNNKGDVYLIRIGGKGNKYDRRSDTLSKGFRKHKVKLGYPAKQIKADYEQTLRDFHSFRNTVNTFLQSKKIIRSHREQLCGWSKMFKDNSMAEEVYLDMLISYPFSERKRDIELLSEFYDWL